MGPIADIGWTAAHHEGRGYVETRLGGLVETRFIERVSEAKARKVIESELTRERYDAVFATSYGFKDAVKELARDFKDVKFYHCSGEFEAFQDLPNVTTYFAEFCQLYYLNGVVAGAVTESCKVGYVPAFLIPEVVRHINAFALGAVHGAKLMGKCGGGERLEIYSTSPLKDWFAPDAAASSARHLVIRYNVNAQAVIQKNNEAWKSFFELLKLRKQGRLPPHIKKISPPGYWKDRLTGKKEVRILVRSDRYHLEPFDENGGYLVLEDFGLRIRYAGRIRWEDKQGRLEIVYVNGKWFAYLPIEVGREPPKSIKKGYVKPNYKDRRGRIVNPKSIKQRDPVGDEKAFMDMGLNNLFAVVTTNGYVLLVKGGVIKSEYYWWKREISTYQAVRDLLRNAGIPTWVYYHEIYLEALHTRDERLRHLYRTSIRFLAETLWSRGVRKLYIGYPIMLSHDNGNEYNTNIWWYRKIVLWIVDVFREYGIEVELVPEYYTSKECSICGEMHENGRVYRGLYVCGRTGRKVKADVNAAINMARRKGYKVKIMRKIESYIVTHNGVKPLNPHRRANTRDPEVRNPAL